LVELIGEALLRMADIRSDQIAVPSAIMRRARRLTEQSIQIAQEWNKLAAEPWGPAGSPAARAQASLNSFRWLLHQALDPQDQWEDLKIHTLVEAVDDAFSMLAAIGLPLPHGLSGRTLRGGPIDRLVLAVCIYRSEQELTVHYDFDPRTGRADKEDSNRLIVGNMPNDTAALAAKALETWEIIATPSELRTALRKSGALVQSLGRPLNASDLLVANQF